MRLFRTTYLVADGPEAEIDDEIVPAVIEPPKARDAVGEDT